MPENQPNAEKDVPDRKAMRAAHRDSYPMGNIHHGTPERPDWGTFCVECKESWPCEVTLLLDFIDRVLPPVESDVPRPVLDVAPCGCHHPKVAGCDCLIPPASDQGASDV